MTKSPSKVPHITALITARRGSSLKGKSFIPVHGKHSLERATSACLGCEKISDFYVSSDCPDILDFCSSQGYTTIRRPDALGASNALHEDVVAHALTEIKASGSCPDYLLVVLPNNPFITGSLVNESIELLGSDPSASACAPVYEYSDHHPYRSKQISGDYLSAFVDTGNVQLSTNRQDLKPCYFFSHNFWLLRLDRTPFSSSSTDSAGEPPWSFMGPRVIPLIMAKSHDIHTLEDVIICEQLLAE
ncbi:MAG: NTP transferase domain-containing protein [Cyanobium sp. LacPavin_0920_WC12_MAG_63_22]|nr:NTP transferase domain-containing protein [Cyanobium sp. LacPavin_0920_WC12_MAG_63_22]